MESTKADWEAARTTTVAEVIRGSVDESDIVYGRDKIAHALRVASGPVLRTELRIVRHRDPARVQASFVEMHAVVNGRPVRAHASAPTVHEAIDRCAERFRHRIQRSHDRVVARHERREEFDAWHHGDAARNHPRPPGVFPRDPDERRLIRRKLFSLEEETVDEAIEDLELLDHDFFLFLNVETGQPNLVARAGNRYRLWSVDPGAAMAHEIVAPVDIAPTVAPECSVEDARALLALAVDELSYVFFVDQQSGRGSVVYRRRDGHDGVIAAR